MSKIYTGDVGTELLVDTGEDITTATEQTLKVKKPDGTEVDWDGTVSATTKIRYLTEADDLDQTGKYKVQAFVDMPDWEGRGDTANFTVEREFR